MKPEFKMTFVLSLFSDLIGTEVHEQLNKLSLHDTHTISVTSFQSQYFRGYSFFRQYSTEQLQHSYFQYSHWKRDAKNSTTQKQFR